MPRRSLLAALGCAALLFAPLPAHGGGLLSRLFWRESPREQDEAPAARVRMLELEVVERPAVKAIVAGLATLKLRVRQLTNPDPQFSGPPLRLRRFSATGVQLEQRWIEPNTEGIYETSVVTSDAATHYLYFDTANHRTVLAKVPWVVLRQPGAD